jgi:hypothetical protein
MSIESLRAIATDPDVIDRDYAPEIEAAITKIETDVKVIAEKDAEIAHLNSAFDDCVENANSSQAEVERQAKVIVALREALKPFAKLAKDDDLKGMPPSTKYLSWAELTIADVQRAGRVYEQSTPLSKADRDAEIADRL